MSEGKNLMNLLNGLVYEMRNRKLLKTAYIEYYEKEFNMDGRQRGLGKK